MAAASGTDRIRPARLCGFVAGARLCARRAAGGRDAARDGGGSDNAEGAAMGPKVTRKNVQQAERLDQEAQGARIENSTRLATFGRPFF